MDGSHDNLLGHVFESWGAEPTNRAPGATVYGPGQAHAGEDILELGAPRGRAKICVSGPADLFGAIRVAALDVVPISAGELW
jgi:hypothetical protein